MGTDEWFECRNIECDVTDAAVDIQVGGLRHHDSAPEPPACMVAVGSERVLSAHFAGVEPDAALLA